MVRISKKTYPSTPGEEPIFTGARGEHDEYDLLSYGEDGVAGGDGENRDIVSWEK